MRHAVNTMLKQKIQDLSIFPHLAHLRALVVRNLGALPRRLDVFRLTQIEYSGFGGGQCYVLETDNHVTPPFLFDGDDVEALDLNGSIVLLPVEEAAQHLARELAEVA